MKITPLGDRVLVEPAKEQDVKKGGIIIPDSAKEKPQEGTVIAVGPGKRLDDGKLQGKRTDANHMRLGRPDLTGVEPMAYRVKDPTNPGEINNVDVDLEMSKMAENQIMFNFTVNAVKAQMESITSAIKGAR